VLNLPCAQKAVALAGCLSGDAEMYSLSSRLFLPAVTDTTTGTVIPNADPSGPDPLYQVNTTVGPVPNARSEGGL
jgi:hypothetical protein